MKLQDPNHKWHFLADAQKSSSPLSKAAVFNHGAQNPQFLEFIEKYTMEAIKELDLKAGSVQTRCLSIVQQVLEHKNTLNPSQYCLICL